MSLDQVIGKLNPFSKAEDKYVLWAKQRYEEMKKSRLAAERQWYLNLAFYFGKQNVVYRTSENQTVVGASGSILKIPAAPPWRQRYVSNRIRPIVRTEIAKLTSQKPNVYVIPSSSEDSDMMAAQAGEQIWESLYSTHKVKNVIRKAVYWSQITGTGFIKTYWDPKKQSYSSDEETSGDICFRSETPFHIFVPDLKEEELEDQPYLIQASIKSRDFLKMCYPNLSLVNTQEEQVLDKQWLSMQGTPTSRSEKGILCLEVWVKPMACELLPEGGMFMVAGQELIIEPIEGWPYSHGKYPYSKIDHIPTGKFYSESTITDLVPPQREYNRINNQIIESKNLMGKPQWLIETGAVDVEKMTSEPGLCIEYETGYTQPEQVQPVSLPSYIIQMMEIIVQDMDDISGQHEISRGSPPPGVTAGTAISYLQEQDESKLSPTFASLEEAIEKTAHLSLSYVHDYWEEDRLLKVVGTDGSFDAKTFKGADLRGNLDIRVEGGSALPTSRAAKQAYIMDLMDRGFVDPNKGLEVMEIGGIGKIYESIQVDVRQAQRENLKLMAITPELVQQYQQGVQLDMQEEDQRVALEIQTNGKPLTPHKYINENGQPVEAPPIIPTNTFDEHKVHIEIHNKFRKGQSFDLASPEVKNAFEEHVKMHVEAMINAQIAANMAAEGMSEAGGNPELGKMEKESSEPTRTGEEPIGGETV